jgi:C1A family cysteine protease
MANRVRDSQRRLRGVVSASLFLFSQTVSAKNLLPMEDYQPIFNDWMTKYSIPISETEYQMRLQIFADTHDLIETHNAGLLSILFLLSRFLSSLDHTATYQLGHNQFSHLSLTEFAEQSLSPFSLPKKPSPTNSIHRNTGASPSSWDWSTSAGVTAVKDQGKCR